MTKTKDLTEHIFLRGWRPYAWIAALVILAYGWSVNYGYTYFDDDSLILKSENQLKGIGGIGKAFAGKETGVEALFYRPVLRASFILNYRLSGIKPWGYHLVNILLHLSVCLLLFEFLKRIGLSAKAAMVCCVLFAVHPVNVQAVSWIPGRNDTLLALFLLSGAILFIGYFSKGGMLRYLLGLLSLSLALLTKESAVVFPAVIIGYALLMKKAGWRNKRLWVYAAGSIVIIVLWYWFRTGVLGSGPEWQRNRFISLTEFLFMVVTYLGKTFLPLKLSPVAVPQWPAVVTGIVVLTVLIGLIFYKGVENGPLFRFGLLWLAAFSLPYFARGSFVTLFLEHRFYLPFMGLLVSLSQIGFLGSLAKKKLLPLFLAIIISLFIVRDISYGSAFKDRRSFWEQAEKTSPESALVLYNAGLIHHENKRYDLAISKYLAALRQNPDYAGVYNNLGMAYQAVGRPNDAEKAYRQAIVLNDDFAKAHDNLGSLYYQQGNYEMARREFIAAIKINDLPSAHNNLGSLYYLQGNYQKAGQEFIKAVELDPILASAHVNLGSCYLKQGYSDKAENEYLSALKLAPGNVDAVYNLSLIYSENGRYDRAEQLLLEGISAHPEEKMLCFQLSSFLFIGGKYDSSVKYYDRFLELGGTPDKAILSRLKPFR